MLQDWEKLAEVLDRQRPGWVVAWADQSSLMDLALGNLKINEVRYRVAYSLFHPILHAALEAGLVEEPSDFSRDPNGMTEQSLQQPLDFTRAVWYGSGRGKNGGKKCFNGSRSQQ